MMEPPAKSSARSIAASTSFHSSARTTQSTSAPSANATGRTIPNKCWNFWRARVPAHTGASHRISVSFRNAKWKSTAPTANRRRYTCGCPKMSQKDPPNSPKAMRRPSHSSRCNVDAESAFFQQLDNTGWSVIRPQNITSTKPPKRYTPFGETYSQQCSAETATSTSTKGQASIWNDFARERANRWPGSRAAGTWISTAMRKTCATNLLTNYAVRTNTISTTSSPKTHTRISPTMPFSAIFGPSSSNNAQRAQEQSRKNPPMTFWYFWCTDWERAG